MSAVLRTKVAYRRLDQCETDGRNSALLRLYGFALLELEREILDEDSGARARVMEAQMSLTSVVAVAGGHFEDRVHGAPLCAPDSIHIALHLLAFKERRRATKQIAEDLRRAGGKRYGAIGAREMQVASTEGRAEAHIGF